MSTATQEAPAAVKQPKPKAPVPTIPGLIVGRVIRPRRIMIYGVAGIGKSTWASQAPSPIMLQTERGADDIGVPRLPVAQTFDEFQEQLRTICETTHGYKTLIIDTINGLEQLIHKHVCKKANVNHITDVPFAELYEQACDAMLDMLNGFDWILDKFEMNIILVAHPRVQRFDSPETDAYDRYRPDLHVNSKDQGVGQHVTRWCDDVLFATWKTFVKSTDEGFGRTRSQGISDGTRVIRTQERASHVAKNRLALPYELPMPEDNAYAEYAKFLG